ncbi:MAG: hypothetical protein IT289_12175 [Oligoflexia bacterium]|nr:hypothetical protein [Oligoflexia bacterium]
MLAEKLDTETNTVVIDKLEKVLMNLSRGDETRESVLLRLGDLYSERARLRFMNDMEAEGKIGRGTRLDRERAITLYEEAIQGPFQASHNAAILQLGYLYVAQEHYSKAQALYAQVVARKKPYSNEVYGSALAGQASEAFRLAKYERARTLYDKALQIKELPKRGFALNRRAWVAFHSGQYKEAADRMFGLLSEPQFFTNPTNGSVDVAFQEESARDLAAFLARGQVTEREIKKLLSVSPEQSKQEILQSFSRELDRLGKKQAALMVLKRAQTNPDSQAEKLEGHIRFAQLHYDIAKNQEVVSELEKLATLWKSEGCEPEADCEQIRVRFRKLVTDWGRAEEEHPSRHLVRSYVAYVNVFPEYDMAYWGAQAARKNYDWKTAQRLYRMSSDLLARISDTARTASQRRIFEGSLLGDVEVAELAKDTDARDEAYQRYLKLNPEGSYAPTVRYQKVKLLYDKGQYRNAADGFLEIALGSGGSNPEIQNKAADLALDSLVLAKEPHKIEEYANRLSGRFPNRSAEFQRISRQSVTNQVALVINNPKSDESDAEDALKKLKSVKLDGATTAEQIALFKNRIALAEKTRDLDEIERSSQGLLQIRGLPESDKEFALSRRAWAAEMRLDFGKAYAIYKTMKLSQLSSADREVKLGVLADLAGRNATPHYEAFLKLSRNSTAVQSVAARLIRTANNPSKAFNKYEGYLKANASLYSLVALEIYAQDRDYQAAERRLIKSGMGRTSAGAVFSRIAFFQSFDQSRKALITQPVNGSSTAVLATSLRRYLNNLSDVEQFGLKAVRSGDPLAQFATLSVAQAGYARLAESIQNLPIPRGLNSKAQKEYRTQLESQAEPYQKKSEILDQKVKELWKKADLEDELEKTLASSQGPIRRLFVDQVRYLETVASTRYKSDLSDIRDTDSKSPSASHIQEAKRNVQADPFNTGRINKLKELLQQAGDETFVGYLDARIQSIEGGRRL